MVNIQFMNSLFVYLRNLFVNIELCSLVLDIVFFIFLYQRWIYKTDPTRINEFGYSAEMEKQKLKEESTPQTAITDSPSASTEAVDTTVKTEEAKKED